jgi:hypothetical protein
LDGLLKLSCCDVDGLVGFVAITTYESCHRFENWSTDASNLIYYVGVGRFILALVKSYSQPEVENDEEKKDEKTGKVFR